VSENPPVEPDPEQPRLPDVPTPPSPDPAPEPGIDPAPPTPEPEPVGAPDVPGVPVAPDTPSLPPSTDRPASPLSTGFGSPEEPFGRPPRSGGGGRKVLLILGGLVVLALVVGGLLFAMGDSDDGDDSPEQAVRDFFEASEDKDCARLTELVVEKSWSQGGTVTRESAIEQCSDEMEAGPQLDTELKSVDTTSEQDDKAVVRVNYTLDDETVDTEIDLVREDGDWKIDSV
jgi:hypothetical protein